MSDESIDELNEMREMSSSMRAQQKVCDSTKAITHVMAHTQLL